MGKTIGLICGQVSKSAALYEQLAKRGFNITAVDMTENKLKHKIAVLKAMKACDIIISVVGAEHLPLLYKGKKYFKCTIYNFMGADLTVTPKNKKYLNSFEANIAEFAYLAEAMEKEGITNCGVVPPFKDVNSRGALTDISDKGKSTLCTLENNLEVKAAVDKYNSCHDEKITLAEDITADSLALIIPNECNSKLIIESYAKGLPVIAGDIGGNSELIRNFETGWVYPNQRVNTLYESLEYAMSHKDEITAMRPNSALLSTRYTPNYVVPRIIEKYLK